MEEKQYLIGVDVGGTTVKSGLFSKNGRLLEKWEIKTECENGASQLLEDIKNTIILKLQQLQIALPTVAGIGIGVPGSVDGNGVVIHAPNIGWKNFDAAACLSQKIGLPIFIENDANLAAFGELAAGSGQGKHSMAFLTLGTGVGGAIIVNGQLLPGFHGGAGELGHMTMNPDETKPCNCGKRGCLEQYASATGIANLALKYMGQAKGNDKQSILFAKHNITAKEVFDCVKQDDALALKIAEEFGQKLGHALALVSSVIDPQIFVIGGGVSKAGDIILSFIKKHYLKFVFTTGRETEFAIASLGNDAGIYGGMHIVRQRLFSRATDQSNALACKFGA